MATSAQGGRGGRARSVRSSQAYPATSPVALRGGGGRGGRGVSGRDFSSAPGFGSNCSSEGREQEQREEGRGAHPGTLRPAAFRSRPA